MNNNFSYIHNGKHYEVVVVQKKYKNLKFSVRLEQGKLKVYTNFPLNKIQENLLILKPKIDHLLENASNVSPINLQEKYFYFLGQKYDFDLVKTNNEYYLYAKNFVFKIKSHNKNTLKLQIIDNINKKLLEYIKTRISYWVQIMHTPDFEVILRDKTSTWATNHITKRKIYFSKKLFPFSRNTIDYIIVHELTHYYQTNHSQKFWSIVAKYKPDYLEIKRKLKKNQYD
ncbi:YgjP-like metallopeptidase domain-containing protein [Mycoplasma sp. 1654_15]|uniref:YgjP-like metallopeptidase domain-containing protein n=1 Tax=Mycoplasma sp. 1654_15 TaxID=2725994 RepID=UPI0014493371|nr:YgjP-like metallopeptidase domain-containing protein [Mycoplasma sp. 1654_15]QJB71362.1 M48 family metallopeptidase [Mycoplasma sp. 1654_15]